MLSDAFRNPEYRHHLFELHGLIFKGARGCGRFFYQGRVLLGRRIHFRHGLGDL